MAIDPVQIAAELNINKVTLPVNKFNSVLSEAFSDKGVNALTKSLADAGVKISEIEKAGSKAEKSVTAVALASEILNRQLQLFSDAGLKGIDGQATALVKTYQTLIKTVSDFAKGKIDSKQLSRVFDEFNKATKDVEGLPLEIRQSFDRQLAGALSGIVNKEIKSIDAEIKEFRQNTVANLRGIKGDLQKQLGFAQSLGNTGDIEKLKNQIGQVDQAINKVSKVEIASDIPDKVKQLKEFGNTAATIENRASKVAGQTQQREQETNRILKEQADQKKIGATEQRRARRAADLEVRTIEKTEDLQRKINVLLEKTENLRVKSRQEVSEEQRRLQEIANLDAKRLANNKQLTINNGRIEGIISQDEIERLVRAQTETNKLNRQIAEARSGVEVFGRQIALAFRRYGAFLIGGGLILRNVINFFRSATNEALEFEKQITRVQQVLDQTDKFAQNISASIREASRATGVVAAEIAKGTLAFAQSGITEQEDLLEIVREISKVPLSATFDDIGTTAEGLIAIFGQFNKEASQTSEILDLVNQFSADFAIESSDFFEAAKRGGAAFATAGGSLEDFVQLLSVLRESTRETASTLGTFFKTGFAQLLQGSSQAKLRQLGVTANDVTGQLVQLAEILNSDRFTNVERINIARELTGQRQFARLLALLREINDPEIQDRLQRSLAAAPGSFDKSIEKRLDDIGTNLSRIRQGLIDFINALTEDQALKNFINLVSQLSTTVLGLAQNLTPLIPLLGAVATPLIGRGIAATGRASLSALGVGSLRPAVNVNDKRRVRDLGTNELVSTSRSGGLRGQITTNRVLGAAGLAAFGVGQLAQNFGSAEVNPRTGISQQQLGEVLNTSIITGIVASTFGGPIVGAVAGVVTAFAQLTQTVERNRRAQDISYGRNQLNFLSRNGPDALIRGVLGSNVGPRRRAEFGSEDARRDLFESLRDDIVGVDPDYAFIGKAFGEGVQLLADNIAGNINLDTNADLNEAQKLLFNSLVRSLQDSLEGAGLKISREEAQELLETLTAKGLLNVQTDRLIKQFNDEIFIGINNFRQSIIDVIDNLNVFGENLNNDLDSLNSIITNPLELQRVQGATNNRELFKQSGLDTLVTSIVDVNEKISDDLSAFFRENRESIRAFFDSQEGFDEGFTESSNLRDTLRSILSFGSVNGASEIQPLIDDVISRFGDSFNRLAAEADISLFELFSQLVNETDFDKAVEGLRNTQAIEEAVASAVRKNIEVFNRRLEIERQLAANILQTEIAISQLTQRLGEIENSIAQVNFEQQAFIGNFTELQRLIGQANLALSQAGSSRFGNTGQFVTDTISTAQRAFRDQQNLSGGAGRSLQEQQDLVSRAASSQQDFLRAQAFLGERLNELQGRISAAAQASQLLRQAFESQVSGLQSFGSSISQLTTKDLANAITAFKQFNKGGLESLNRSQFDSLTKLLSSLGDLSLGGGVTGKQLLGDINQQLGTEALAVVRSALTGNSLSDSRSQINSELEALRQQQEAAANLEKQLREEEKQLVNLQIQLQREQLNFFKSQEQLLREININISNIDFQQIQSQINKLFSEALPVTDKVPTRPPSVTIDPRTISAPPQIVESRPNRVTPTPIGPSELQNPLRGPANPYTLPNRPGNRVRPEDLTPNVPFDTRQPFDPFAPSERQRPDLIYVGQNNLGSFSQGATNTDFAELNRSITSIQSLLEKISGEGFRSVLEISPINVNVQLTAPDILRTAGPQIKSAIMREIAIKLADIFTDSPEVSGRIASELGTG